MAATNSVGEDHFVRMRFAQQKPKISRQSREYGERKVGSPFMRNVVRIMNCISEFWQTKL